MRPLTQKQVEQMQLRYYNSDVHRAAFVLPEFARKVSPWWMGLVGGPRASWGACLSPQATLHPPDQASCPTRP